MVDLYLGGMEHTTLHLLYSRFWHQFFYDQGLVPTPEPYAARRGQGIILAADGSKMSKSKGNVVNPVEIIDSGYGADALRLAIAFLAPYDQTTPWSPESVAGTHRLLQRVWALVQEFSKREEKDDNDTIDGSSVEADLMRAIHQANKKVTADLQELNFNTAIAAIMECVNHLFKLKDQDDFQSLDTWRYVLDTLVQLLAPLAPHITEELWVQLGHEESVHLTEWPAFDEQYLVRSTVNIAIQVNGKLRGEVEVAADADEDTVVESAKSVERVAQHIGTTPLRKTIYIKGKIVNFVI
jgi:leucyl-tRNA synthetase